jgi:hypothetical protein
MTAPIPIPVARLRELRELCKDSNTNVLASALIWAAAGLPAKE